jgi:hypothetical protein
MLIECESSVGSVKSSDDEPTISRELADPQDDDICLPDDNSQTIKTKQSAGLLLLKLKHQFKLSQSALDAVTTEFT